MKLVRDAMIVLKIQFVQMKMLIFVKLIGNTFTLLIPTSLSLVTLEGGEFRPPPAPMAFCFFSKIFITSYEKTSPKFLSPICAYSCILIWSKICIIQAFLGANCDFVPNHDFRVLRGIF